jgi:hypothetical protein
MTNRASEIPDGLNRPLRQLLGIGSWVSCGLMGAGIMLHVFGPSTYWDADHLISAGIVLLIGLPALRVATMGVWFYLHRDWSFTLVAVLVIAIIIVSTLLGVRSPAIVRHAQHCDKCRESTSRSSGWTAITARHLDLAVHVHSAERL